MKLLHGSNVTVKKPDLKFCQSRNDFGRGFYLTPNWNRAWEMGKRRKNIKSYKTANDLRKYAAYTCAGRQI